MPIYEYECNACNCRFEKKQKFNDEPTSNCPKCRSAAKRIMCPAAVIYKGSGFYVTDYPKSGGN